MKAAKANFIIATNTIYQDDGIREMRSNRNNTRIEAKTHSQKEKVKVTDFLKNKAGYTANQSRTVGQEQ